jgi:hypothetical protein
MLVVILKLGKASVMVTMIALTLVNIFIILRNAYQLDKNKVFITNWISICYDLVSQLSGDCRAQFLT